MRYNRALLTTAAVLVACSAAIAQTPPAIAAIAQAPGSSDAIVRFPT